MIIMKQMFLVQLQQKVTDNAAYSFCNKLSMKGFGLVYAMVCVCVCVCAETTT